MRSDLRSRFPIFATDPELIYLDSSATNQRPQEVIDAVGDFYSRTNSNIHRSLYPLGEAATILFESAREDVARFIGAEPEEVIFTSGATDSLNGAAVGLERAGLLGDEPHLLLSPVEHHSNLLPWQQIKGARSSYFNLSENFELSLDESRDWSDVRLVAFTHMSNVTGAIVPVKEMAAKIRELMPQAIIVLDAAQSLSHIPINVKALDVDLIAFAGHKAYGPTGIGMLYGRRELLEKMEPFRYGGGMISEVHRDHATWAGLPAKFEAGTPPIASAIGMGAAVRFLEAVGWDDIQKHEHELINHTQERLTSISGLRLFHPEPVEQHGGVFGFVIDGVHPHDLTHLLGERSICIRAGHHCAQILHRDILKVPATSRISLALYNTVEEIDKAIDAISESVAILR